MIMTEDDDTEMVVIKSHSVIKKVVTRCLSVLNGSEGAGETAKEARKLKVVADAKVAGKAITIVEIVKRRMTEHGGTIKQTTAVQEKLVSTEETSENAVGSEKRTHLQGEGFQSKKKKWEAQIVILLEKENKTDGA